MEMADGGGGVGGAVSAWCAGSELGGRRLLAVLEAGTLLLVALALLLHALRTRTGRAARRTLRGQHVLITKGDSAVGRELARQFAAEGCAVSVLRAGESAPAPAAAPALDVLVVCGAQGGEGLDALSKAVSEEVYSNFHLLEELGGRMRAGGRLVWVSGAAAGAASGGYAGAARSLQELARSLLEQVAARSGCRAVWCEAGTEGQAECAATAAARVIRRVAHDQALALPSSADVFRELGHKVRNVVYHSFARCAKLWT